MADDIHWEDSVFIKASQRAKRNYRFVRHPENLAKIFAHIYESNVAKKLPVLCVNSARRKIDSNEIIEHQCLWRLREFTTAVGQRVVFRVEYFA